MSSLLTYNEMSERYEKGENAFEITVDKWKRIRENIETAYSPQQFQDIFESAAFKVPLCMEYEDNCAICPLNKVCRKGEEGSFGKFMRVSQAYCIAGDVLPSSILSRLAEQVISELEVCREEVKKNIH